MSSCAASSSTCCRAASTRCVTSVCGIPRNATTPPGCGRCCNSRRHPSLAHRRTSSSRHASTLTQSQCRRSSHGSVRTVSGAAGLHPHALAARATGHGAVITTSSFHRHRPVLPLRASERQQDPLSPTQADDPTLTQMTLPIVLKAPLPTATLAVVPRRPAGRAAIISPRSERPW